MAQNKFMTVVILAATVALGGCQASSGQGPEDDSDALIVVAGSRDVTFHRLRGTHRLTYMVDTDYPATQTIQEISRQLLARGWSPLEKTYLNPAVPTSHVTGWESFSDGTSQPLNKVHQWHGQWINKTQDVLSYTFRYSYHARTEPDLSHLQVIAIYTPAAVNKHRSKRARSSRTQHARRSR